MKRPILIVAILFTALLLFYLIFEGEAPNTQSAPVGERFLPLKATDIQGVNIVTREGLIFKCVKDSDGSWNVINGERKTNASEKINDFIEAITTLMAIDHFSVTSTELSQFGLQEPSTRITLTDLTQKTYDMLIGDKTPDDATGVYVKLADANEVAIMGAVLNWELLKISSLFVFQEGK